MHLTHSKNLEMSNALLVCLLTLSVLAQCSLASPLSLKDRRTSLPGAIESAVTSVRARRAAMEPAAPAAAAVVSADASPSLLLSRLRRSMAQMYTGNIHYNSHRRASRQRRRHGRRHHRHHHRRHGACRVYEA